MDVPIASLGSDFVHAFSFMGNHTGHLLHDTVGTIALSAAAVGVALGVALPIGVWLGHLHRGSFVAINIANLGRALPELGLIALFLAILGIGFLNVMVALAIVAIPPILANSYTAVAGVDPEVVDAARGMGMSPLGVLRKVELPLALPLTFAGIRTAVLFVVGASPLAAIAGGGGLGEVIVNQASYGFPGVLAAALWVAALALIAQGLFAALQMAITPAGLKAKGVAGPGPTEVAALEPAGELVS